MDHRITTAIVLCVGGTIAFTLMLAMFSSSVPADAAAAQPAATPAADERLHLVLRQLESAGYRFRRQHGGADPDFAAHPHWEQFLGQTDARGRVVGAPTKDLVGPMPKSFGPYLSAVPVNPLNGRSDVLVTAASADPGDHVPGGPAGFVYSTARQQFAATDATGRAVAGPIASP